MNKTILQGKWRRVRGNLKTEWGRLTDNDRRQLDGKLDQMLGLVQERYGYTQAGATKVLTRYLGDYGKRRQASTVTAVQLWKPLMGLVGVCSLAMLGWFFFSRFLAEAPPAPAAAATEEAYMSGPELDWA